MSGEPLVSNIILLFYIFIWIITVKVYQNRKGYFDAGSLIIFSYLLYSVISLLLYNSPFYKFNPITLLPFVYLYLMIMIFMLPVLRYNANKINVIQRPSTNLLNIICIIFIIASLIQLPNIISDFSVNILRLLSEPSGGQDIYNEAMANSDTLGKGSISNLPSIITNAYGNFGILLFFYYLTLQRRNKFILIGLSISVTIGLLTNLTMAQRGPTLQIILSLILTYFILRRFISPKINFILKIIGVSLIIATIIPIIILTNSRFSTAQGGSLHSVYYYAGQENLNFNNYGLDNGGIRYGDRTFPLFKRMLGFENVPHNFWERRFKYPNLHINDEVFIGFVGDFTLDFGPIIPPIIFILFILFVLKNTKVRKKKLLFHQLILIHFVMCVCMLGGMKLYSFADIAGNLQLIVYFLAFICFRIDYDIILQKTRRLK